MSHRDIRPQVLRFILLLAFTRANRRTVRAQRALCALGRREQHDALCSGASFTPVNFNLDSAVVVAHSLPHDQVNVPKAHRPKINFLWAWRKSAQFLSSAPSHCSSGRNHCVAFDFDLASGSASRSFLRHQLARRARLPALSRWRSPHHEVGFYDQSGRLEEILLSIGETQRDIHRSADLRFPQKRIQIDAAFLAVCSACFRPHQARATD